MPAKCPTVEAKTSWEEGRPEVVSFVARKQVATTEATPTTPRDPPTAVCRRHPTFSSSRRSMPSRSPRLPHDRAAPGAGRSGPRRSPAPAAGRRRVTPATPPRARRVVLFPRSASETALWTRRSASGGNDGRDDDDGSTGGLQILPRHYTCTDLCPTAAGFPFSPSPPSPPEGRDVEWGGKVLVTVTVEGSPGPVRAMVRLGASVEEAIGAVVGVYGREGRSPKLDPAAVPSFQLHHNHFCLQSLNKEDTLGQVGGRNFYLRRSRGGEATAARGGQEVGSFPLPPLLPLCSHRLLAIVARRLSKIGRKLWRALGCATCG